MTKLRYQSQKTRIRINQNGTFEVNTAPEKNGEWIEFTPFNYSAGNEEAVQDIMTWLENDLQYVKPDEEGYIYLEAPFEYRTKEIIATGEGHYGFIFHKFNGQLEISLGNMFNNAFIRVMHLRHPDDAEA